ncbi:MAG: carbamoyltransferase HypF [Verrucomicrobiota bacterium]
MAWTNSTISRRRYRARGVVQGVGFRPFVYRLARSHGLGGYVLNDGDGVVIEVEGAELDAFADELVSRAPSLASVTSVTAEPVAPLGETDFRIVESVASGHTALIPPDVATCDECLRELFDPADRRYRYPFINCTQCGPRFTIVRAVPYDRPNTTMAGFPLCPECRREYEDPLDRRFHAEPIACPVCGPQLTMPLEEAVAVLDGGGILAVKGLGGYHLACGAADEAAVSRLRGRKHREAKPFAVMSDRPGRLVHADEAELNLLRSRERPIVLLRRVPGAPVAESVAPGSGWLGVMLPYTPLHHLLCRDFGAALVMTSGNLSDEPIAFEDDEARRRLAGIADAFLSHDRPIHRRCEDSVWIAGNPSDSARHVFPVRRSRGYAPKPLPLPVSSGPTVAAGAMLKSTFCVANGRDAHLSPHLGDLDTEGAYRAFVDDLELYLDMLGVEPERVACDLHPEYLATKWAHEQGLPLVEVQHHHAHAAACLAEHREDGPALALVFDGTGLGTDGTLWGGELLRCDLRSSERLAGLDPIPLPGGEAAIREPWRVASMHLDRAGLPVPWPRWSLVRESLKANAPLSSGMGRLFDAVAAVLGFDGRTVYEGQAAVELEQLAGDVRADPWPWRFGASTELVTDCYLEASRGRDPASIAASFHETVAASAAAACADAATSGTVVLSGGTFQNVRLLRSTRERLEALGFRVLTHELVPPNDGGISYGQAAVAAARAA